MLPEPLLCATSWLVLELVTWKMLYPSAVMLTSDS
jgi:hypothetical protein